MMPNRTFARREALQGAMLVALTMNAGVVSQPARAQQSPQSNRILVVYFSRTGNTRVIARHLSRTLKADLFEIQPAAAYPEDYEETVAQAQKEREAGYEPSLNAPVPGIASYETIYLGFPIWGTSAPAVIRSFLSGHDLAGKTLIPFITHGGYGLGDSLSVVARHAPRARLREAFSLQADQERETLSRVSRWLADARG